MIRIFGHYLSRAVLGLALFETFVLLGALYGAQSLRLSISGLGDSSLDDPTAEYAIFVVTIQTVMLILGLYQRDTWRSLRQTVVTLTAAFVLSTLVMALLFFLYPPVALWRSIFVSGIVVAFIAILLVRLIFIGVLDLDLFKSRVLVLGAGKLAERIAGVQQGARSRSFSEISFLRMGHEAGNVSPVHQLAEIPSLRDFALEKQVDEIVTAMEERRGALPVRELLDCRLAGIRITDYAAFMERETGKVDLDGFVPSWLIYSQGSTEAQIRLLIKRGIDLLASLVLVTLTAPVVLLAALLVRLTSPGPVLFRQERVGQHGRTFMLYKFRSMRVDAEAGGPKWASENDPRVTAVGRVIRKLRIDELPQIFNVLKGDMSFVGPRPEQPKFVADLARQLPYYAERHTVRPGITGWAQVNYPYGASVEDAWQKAQYDLYYIKNFSVFLDILILIKTIRVILFGTGAR
ncbi:TIGR03013 family XrtA/PEP-CTERM system glycosyltransferase [Emcibacter sp. SYSU 3D8]|uniref:TIGR03013 family XrtA/PEP-CTERM system glycosyltransferase n=1 Tax=Emcibacter sp. SYSU 3D8 TaxID=3133969 RepID=UPI0031FF4297